MLILLAVTTQFVGAFPLSKVALWWFGPVKEFHGSVCQFMGGSVSEWLACWTQAHKGPGSNRSRDAVG